MRVALVLPDLNGGGAERVALTLAQDLLDKGHDVDIVLTRSGGELTPLIPAGAKLFELNARRFRIALLPLIRYFRARKPDATHALMWPVTVVAIVAHWLAGCPGRLVLSDHNTLSKQYGGRKSAIVALRHSTAWWYGNADARICVSDGSAVDLAKVSGLNADDFQVIYNPVIPPKPLPRASNRQRALWKGDGPRLLNVGSFKDQKNQKLLLRAFAKVVRQRPASLLILGEGLLRAELEALAAELGVADRVSMPGFAVDPWPVYAAADLFVLSSDYEGYPLVLLEAMFSGLTIVSTDCPSGPREILDGGRYGQLAPLGNADALSAAIIEAIAEPVPPEMLKQRAEDLSAGSLKAHREALFGSTEA